MQRVRHANRGRLLLRTPGPVPLWDLHVFLCRDQSLLNLSCLRTFGISNTPRYFSFALNLSNILNQKSVQSKIPPYFEYKESPCISYSYTSSVATKIFNYKTSLQQIDFQSLSQNPLPCSCSGSEFLYAPCGHIVTGDLNIVRNDKLRDLLRKGTEI